MAPVCNRCNIWLDSGATLRHSHLLHCLAYRTVTETPLPAFQVTVWLLLLRKRVLADLAWIKKLPVASLLARKVIVTRYFAG